ncbi:hypothetical protein ANAPRD1_00518 [Anaplasma phagocytophilum]|nr:hypothetical protein ANAPRD1_00518 [Anaplasma phagocytophilum]
MYELCSQSMCILVPKRTRRSSLLGNNLIIRGLSDMADEKESIHDCSLFLNTESVFLCT